MKGRGDTLSAKVLKAMSVFSGVQVIGIVCSVVRAKLVSLWIGPFGVGLFAIFNSVLEMLSTATQCNMRQSSVRDISAAPPSELPRVAGAVRWWARRLGMFGAAVIILLSPVLSLVSFGDVRLWWGFALLSVSMFAAAYVSGEQALMQGSGRLRALARSTVIGSVAGTVCSVPMYYYLGEGSIVPSIIVFSITSVAGVCLSSDIKGVRTARAENIALGRGFMRLGLYLTLSSLVTSASSYIFLSYLTHVGTESLTGVYQAGYTLVIRYVGIVFTALALEFYPRIVKVSGRGGMASVVVSHETVLLLCVLTPMLVLLISLDRWVLTLLYSSEFLAALPFVTIGVVSAVFRVMSFCMAYVILARGDGRIYIFTETLSSAVGLALNILCFTQWSFVGLGVSYVLWYLLYTIIVGVVYYRRYGMRLTRGAVAMSAVAVVTACAAVALKLWAWWAPLLLLPFVLYGCGRQLGMLLRRRKNKTVYDSKR